jgi:predicted dehydrogenase
VKKAGGGAIVDMGCHCIEIARSFAGKGNRPVEVMCWADTLVHPIEGEDHGIGLIRFESGAVGQFEVSWAFRGGMDLRDEVSGTEGTIWIDHFLRTGLELFTAAGQKGYVSEKVEGETGWLFPVGDEIHELGYPNMLTDMLDALDAGREPVETFYDGYVVNAIMDACYRSAESRRWEAVKLEKWSEEAQPAKGEPPTEYDGKYIVIKKELTADGKTRLILKDKETNQIVEEVVS